MRIINLLETLAGNTRFQIEIDDAISSQSSEIQKIFNNNDSTSLKLLFKDSEISADRTTIFQI
jgi:hypothetical protein